MYRTQSLISGGGDVLCGGIVDEDDKFISPTIMTSELTYPVLLPLRRVTLPPTLTRPPCRCEGSAGGDIRPGAARDEVPGRVRGGGLRARGREAAGPVHILQEPRLRGPIHGASAVRSGCSSHE